MPGWTSATAPTPVPERQIRNDLMPTAERTSRRTRQWQADLNWWQKERERRQQEAIRRIAASPPRLLRPPHAPWGEPQGMVAGLEEPPF
jgi:hypothetical protein